MLLWFPYVWDVLSVIIISLVEARYEMCIVHSLIGYNIFYTCIFILFVSTHSYCNDQGLQNVRECHVSQG
jgi:hypothetical protein